MKKVNFNGINNYNILLMKKDKKQLDCTLEIKQEMMRKINFHNLTNNAIALMIKMINSKKKIKKKKVKINSKIKNNNLNLISKRINKIQEHKVSMNNCKKKLINQI